MDTDITRDLNGIPAVRSARAEVAGKDAQSGHAIWQGLRRVHLPALWDVNDRSYARCIIGLYYAVAEIRLPGDFAQFGVYRGRSARFLESFLTSGRKLHLFDSFEGLPTEWTGVLPAGAFRLREADIPRFDPETCVVHRGWFRDTAPSFVADYPKPLAFIHMDADLYTSTMDVFDNINALIVPETIIMFDEYVMKESDEEHRALMDWTRRYDRRFEYLWRTNGAQVCIRILQ